MKKNSAHYNFKKFGAPVLLLIALLVSGFAERKDPACLLRSFTFENDSVSFELFQVKDSRGVPIVYYRDIDQYPCEDSVCARMVLRLYWDMWGNFLKIGLDTGQQLTKLGHEPFSDKDYERLHKLLIDPDCNLQYYKLDDLTDKESEKIYYKVDAISSATIKNVSYDSVRGAVKTCYSLWKIVHSEIQNEIQMKTKEALANQASGDRLLKIAALIEKDSTLEDDGLNLVADHPDPNDTAFLLSLLELNRHAPSVSNDLMERLIARIQNQQSVSETAIYNFLLHEAYIKKEVRKYNLSRNYFEIYQGTND